MHKREIKTRFLEGLTSIVFETKKLSHWDLERKTYETHGVPMFWETVPSHNIY